MKRISCSEENQNDEEKKAASTAEGKGRKKEGRLVSIQTKEEAEENWRGGERGNLYKRRGGRGKREITVPWPPAVVSTRPEGGRGTKEMKKGALAWLGRVCVCGGWWGSAGYMIHCRPWRQKRRAHPRTPFSSLSPRPYITPPF